MRCPERHPTHTQVRCEERAGHLDDQRPHFNSFFMRSWDEPEREVGLEDGPASAP